VTESLFITRTELKGMIMTEKKRKPLLSSYVLTPGSPMGGFIGVTGI